MKENIINKYLGYLIMAVVGVSFIKIINDQVNLLDSLTSALPFNPIIGVIMLIVVVGFILGLNSYANNKNK